MATTVKQAIDDYLASDEMQRAALATQSAHRRALLVLLEVVGPRLSPPKLTRMDIDRALSISRAGQTSRGAVRESSLNVHRAAYIKLIRFCHSAGYMPSICTPTSHLTYAPRLTDDGRKRKPITVDQALEMLDIAGEKHPRDRAACALVLFTGMRESELIDLRWRDIRWDTEEIVYYRRKQKSFHTAPFNPMLEKELRAWFEWYRARHPEMCPDWRVIPARLHGKVRSRFDKMNPDWPIIPTRPVTGMLLTFKTLLSAVGVTDLEGKGAHTLRRTFANLFYEMTGDIRYVQEALGHKEQRTTEVYMDKVEQREKNRSAMREWTIAPSVRGTNVVPFRRPA